ncbi:MAG: chemotaxis protein CheX [Pirellulaceae bacterium]
MTDTAVAPAPTFTDPELTTAVMGSVSNALTMCDTSARCVGVSAIPLGEAGLITGLIGVHGKVSGFVTVNMAERMAIKAVEGLLQDSYGELTPQVVDGAGEITNIITGGIKSTLSRTQWAFSHITVPSVIIGKGYQIAYARGLQFVCATFEHNDTDAVMLEDRLMRVSVSLLKL